MENLTMDREHLAIIMQRIKNYHHQQQEVAESAKRPAFVAGHDQPLDFSAPSKKFCPSPDWPGPNYNISLGSDGHSDRDQSGSISPTGSHRSTGSGKSPREPQAGTCSPPRPALPNISIPTPSPTSSPSCKPDLLATVPPFAQVSLRPLSSLQQQHPPEVKPPALLGLAGLPYLPFPFHHQPALPQYNTGPSSPSELAKIALESQQKFSEYRENILRNIDPAKDKVKIEIDSHQHPASPNSKSLHNQSLPLSLTPTHSSTPTRQRTKEVITKEKDEAYWDRRRKNNAAAKRSRDSRRAKENDIAIRCSFLEQENIELKMKLVKVITELQSKKDAVC